MSQFQYTHIILIIDLIILQSLVPKGRMNNITGEVVDSDDNQGNKQGERRATQSRKPQIIQQISVNPLQTNPIQSQFQIFQAKHLLVKYDYLISTLLQQPNEERSKHTKKSSLPKFILKLFTKKFPYKVQQKHNMRIKNFIKTLSSPEAQYDLKQLFGENQDLEMDAQNAINRSLLKKILQDNYQNVLKSKHKDKKYYLSFCKEMIYRLNYPELIDGDLD